MYAKKLHFFFSNFHSLLLYCDFNQFHDILKFINSEKATKFCEIVTVDLSYVVPVKSTMEISQNFVAFSEYINFTKLVLNKHESFRKKLVSFRAFRGPLFPKPLSFPGLFFATFYSKHDLLIICNFQIQYLFFSMRNISK